MMTAKQKREEQSRGIEYGCVADLNHGEKPEGCVKDYGHDADCICAPKHKTREGCEYWIRISDWAAISEKASTP